MKTRDWIPPLLALGMTACIDTYIASPTEPGPQLAGSGVLVTQARPVAGFDSVLLAVPGEVILDQTGDESLAITAESNLIDLLTSEVSGGLLVLVSRSQITLAPSWPIHYRLTAREIEALTISGAGRIETRGVEGAEVDFTISGAGEVRASGRS